VYFFIHHSPHKYVVKKNKSDVIKLVGNRCMAVDHDRSSIVKNGKFASCETSRCFIFTY
jgi:hypothetical protein